MTTGRERFEMTADEEQLITFRLGKETFAVSVTQVREIGMVPSISSIPDTADYIEGVMNLRGQVTTVVDLRKRFKIAIDPSMAKSDQARIIVAELDGNLLGLTVDAVETVMRVPKNTIDPPPRLLASGMEGKYLVGICKLQDKLVMLIDLNKIMKTSELEQLVGINKFIGGSATVQ
jgi:purine-binding chemotaxis protein CheW